MFFRYIKAINVSRQIVILALLVLDKLHSLFQP